MPRFVVAALVAGAWAQVAPVATPKPPTPIGRVTKLLQQMQKGAQDEKDKDEKLYEQMDCWCKTNNEAKTQAVKEASAKVAQLKTDVESFAAKIEQLVNEIKDLEGEVAENQDALATATAVREKENAAFMDENSALLQAIGQLDNAIGALKKFNGKPPAAAFLQVKSVVDQFSHRYSEKLQDDLLGVMAAFPIDNLRGNKLALNQQPVFSSYNNRSGEIFGILEQLKETMEKDSGTAIADEKRAQDSYDSLKATKESEIASAKKQIADKNAEKSDTQVAKANAEQDIKDTTDTLEADQQFLLDLDEKCSNWDADFAERQKTRSAEILAISKALEIITGDEARDLFSATVGVNFLQTNTETAMTAARNHASAILRKAVQKGASATLLSLAASTQLDTFTRVKKAMDEMSAKLKVQMAEEAKKRDWCLAEIDATEDSIKDNSIKADDLTENIASLTGDIETLTEEIAALAAAIQTTRVSIKQAGEDRKDQNALFQQTVKDQRATHYILGMVLKRLQEFYNPEALKPQPVGAAAPALVQQPRNFESYKKQGASAGVMELIQEIQMDATTAEKEAMRTEQDAQTAYAAFVSDSNAAVRGDLESKTNKELAKAKADSNRAQAKADLSSTQGEINALKKTEADLHAECDFLTKNFSIRQAALQEEMDAIAQAKAILSGATFD